MEKAQNIYKILDLIQEDQRQLDRTIADLKRHKKATGFIKCQQPTLNPILNHVMAHCLQRLHQKKKVGVALN